MSSSVVVTYTIRPERLAEHVGLVEAVVAELASSQRSDVSYEVLLLADGVSFVHVSTTTAEGSNPLTSLESFRAFTADLASRVATPPVSTAASMVAAYSPGS